MTGVQFILLASFVILSQGQECKLPDMPKGFRARVQMNSIKGFNEGRTHSYAQIVDEANNRSMIHTFREIAHQDKPNEVFEEWFIWDPTMDGFKKFMHVAKDTKNRFSCHTDKLDKNDLYLFIAGYNENDESPTVKKTLHIGSDAHVSCEEDSVMDGVPVKEYKVHIEQATDPLFNLDIVYHWSDPKKWYSTAGEGQSIPIRAKITGTFGRQQGNIQDIELELIFAGFESLPESYKHNWLKPFPAISCEGRKEEILLSTVRSAFTYNFETHTILKGEESHSITIRGREFHNGRDSLLRREFHFISPKNGEEKINYNVVKDFEEGLAYEMNLNTGMCAITPIKSSDSDVMDTDHGSISMIDSLHFWHMEDPYNCNKEVDVRGMQAYAFVRNLKSQKSEPRTFAIYFSSWCEADLLSYDCQVPVRTEEHVRTLYGDPKASLINNIEGFTVHERDHSAFDVSPCLEDRGITRKMIRFPWEKEMQLKKDTNLIYQNIRVGVSDCGGIRPRRIQKVDFFHSKNSNTIYAFFDVLEAGDAKDEGSTKLKEALEKMNKCIEESKLSIEIPKKDWKLMKVTAEPGFFVDVASTDSEAFQGHDFDEYSPGSMAGLGIGMILLGLLVGMAAYYGLQRFDKVPYFTSSTPFIHFNQKSYY